MTQADDAARDAKLGGTPDVSSDEMHKPQAIAGTVSVDDPRSPDVRQLLTEHLCFCRGETPPEDVHALEIADLLDPAIAFFGYRVGGKLAAVGALKTIDAEHAEVKAMHTQRLVRRQGAGGAVLRHIISVARQRGFQRLSLETGTMEAFGPARAMYAKAGFVPCGPFAGYSVSPNSTYMTMALLPGPRAQEATPI